jgi:hypothetical protein
VSSRDGLDLGGKEAMKRKRVLTIVLIVLLLCFVLSIWSELALYEQERLKFLEACNNILAEKGAEAGARCMEIFDRKFGHGKLNYLLHQFDIRR